MGLTLIGFPYAGGSASLFRTWASALPGEVQVCGVQLPGRSNRIAERPQTELVAIVRDLSEALLPRLHIPFAFFGHSLGAILAFEVARYLRRETGRGPTHLFVSGRRAPQIADTDPPSYNKNDADFINYLRELNGTPPAILRDPEILALMLPTLRADFQVAETYQYAADAPLSCAITAFGATGDEESIEGRLDGWRAQSTGAFSRHVFEGDHFFIHSKKREILAIVRRALGYEGAFELEEDPLDTAI